MSIRCLFVNSQDQPAEFSSDNSDECITCGAEYDLDEGDGFRVVEGLPDGVGILCHRCSLLCQDCGEDVTEPVAVPRGNRVVKETVTWIADKPICFSCLCVAVGGKVSD